MDAAAFDNTGFRYRNNDGSETAATWVFVVDTDGELDTDTTYRMRIEITETAGNAANGVTIQWEYNLQSAGWNDITISSSVAKAVTSGGNFTEGDDATQQLGGGGTFVSSNSAMTEDGLTTSYNHGASELAETELCFQIVGADVSDADTLELRATVVGEANSYTTTPSITVNVPALNVDLTFISSTSTLYPLVTESTITPGFIASASAIYAPTISQTISLTFIDSTSTLYSPTVLVEPQIDLSFITSSTTLFNPAMENSITLGFVSSTSIVYAQSAAVVLSVSLGFISSTSVVYAPTIEQTINLTFISTSSILYNPALELTVSLGFISSTTTIYAPTIEQTINTLGFITSSTTLYSPAVALGGLQDIFLTFIPSTVIVYTVAIHFKPPYEIIIEQYHERGVVIDEYHEREIVIDEHHEHEIIIDRDFT